MYTPQSANDAPMDMLAMPEFQDPGFNLGNPADYQRQAQNFSMAASQGQGQIDALSQYPTFANPFGIGSQQPFGQPVAPDKSATTANPSAANRGFNPWSLVGEANAR